MQLWEFALPMETNKGRPYTLSLQTWENYCLQQAGGFTRRPVGQGVWVDEGKVYHDVMQPYHVGCSEAVANLLLAKAFELFSDQVAIFTAEIGEARIVYRGGASG